MFARLAVAALLSVAPPSVAPWATGVAGAEEGAAAPTRILRVATSGDYAPFSFPACSASHAINGSAPHPTDDSAPHAADGSAQGTTDGADLAGFDVEVARRFARERGYRLEFRRFRWPDLGKELAAGSFDLAMSGVTVRPERSVTGRYSVPVVATQAVALTWKGSGATSLEELDKAGRRIFVNAGGHLEQVAVRTFRRAQVHALADNDAVRMALLDRACDAVVTDNFEQKVWTAGARDVVALGPLSHDRKAYLLPADREELAAELDAWLMAREKDGTLATLRKEAFGEDAAATASPAAAFASAVAERQALMPLVWAAKRKAGKPVEDKAQEATVVEAALATLAATAAKDSQPKPDEAAARAVFEQLLVLGKDVQQALADVDARRRPGVVFDRSGASAEAVGDAGDAAKAAERATPVAREAPGARVLDLATELRPAIARITGKIARILLAMEPGQTSTKLTGPLREQITPDGVPVRHLEALADALVVWSSRRPYTPRE
jgi:cyclohexadienyl dehydratase